MKPFSKSRQLRLLAVLAVTALLAACNGSDNTNSPVATATVEGPVAGTATLVSTFFSLASQGYEQAEYFISGTAHAYSNVNELDSDGQWQIEVATQAPYRTRIVVNRPIDPADFNGTVIVEWLNVSAGFESAPDWGMLHTELIRQGYAWVGVSAQLLGVSSLQDGTADALLGLDNSERYQDLLHPGDSFSYDIMSQVGQAISAPTGISPLGELLAQRLIAAGESQSAARMMTYVNALANIHQVYDGYFIHSRLGGSSALSQAPQAAIPAPAVVRVREDLPVPVMMLQTESDLFLLGSFPDRQPDTSLFRLWEIAGTAHADLYTFLDNRFDVGTNPAVTAVVENAAPIPGIISCDKPVNAGPHHLVAKAAIAALQQWIVDGTEPPMADRLATTGNPAAFELDSLGNVKGGIRSSYVDAPSAVLSGEGQSGGGFCFLSGTTELLDAATLGLLYANNAAYITAVNMATDEAVARGFLLAPDAALIKAYVATSDVFNP